MAWDKASTASRDAAPPRLTLPLNRPGSSDRNRTFASASWSSETYATGFESTIPFLAPMPGRLPRLRGFCASCAVQSAIRRANRQRVARGSIGRPNFPASPRVSRTDRPAVGIPLPSEVDKPWPWKGRFVRRLLLRSRHADVVFALLPPRGRRGGVASPSRSDCAAIRLTNAKRSLNLCADAGLGDSFRPSQLDHSRRI